MPNGTSTPDISDILADENFKSLPLAEKHKVLLKVDPDYAGLPPKEQAHALTVIQYGPEPKQEDLGGGVGIARTAYGIGRGLNNVVEGVYQAVVHPINTASGIASQIEEFPGNVKEAQKEPNAISKAADIGAAVPVFGPLGQRLGERAAKGDVAGAVAEGLTTAVAPSAAKELARVGISPEARETARGVGREVTQKYVGKTLANKVFPPPPEPPEVTEYNRAKMITEAQEAAQAENAKRTAAAAREMQLAAKAREAGFNKDAEERMAIQRRADEAQEARVQAEKEAKNARLKAEQAHEKNLKEAESARQKEITAQAKLKQIQDQMDAADKAKEADRLDALKKEQAQAEKDANAAAAQKERLRDQHARDLMQRQKEQDALDRKAQKAGEDEDSAKAAVKKGPTTQGGAGGAARPTLSERQLTTLIKKNILSPDEFNTLKQQLGEDAVPRRGESNAAWRARVLGTVRAGRAAQGMADISSGPSEIPKAAGSVAKPPVTFTTDSLGVKWAHSPLSPEPVSIPSSVPEGEVQEYAQRKIDEYVKMRKGLGKGGAAPTGQVAFRARPVGQNGIPGGASPQATMDPAQAAQYAKDLANTTGQPHEVATIDLSKMPHSKVPHPSGATWVQFGDAHPEDVVTEKSSPVMPTDTGEFQF